MKLAFLYAGQGSQKAGMGKEFYESEPAFRAVFDAPELDFDLKSVCFDDPDGVINETQYTQPCMVAFACGMTALLAQKGIRPEIAAGLSLGEYSALSAAGVLDAKTAVELAAFRGKAMANAVVGRASGMTAVLSLERESLQKCCEEASALGVVQICNDNCPGQMVIGGDAAAVEKAGELARAAGAKRCLPLKVSGPFHTSLMKPAGDALREKFAEITFGEMQIPVLFNCLGREMGAGDTIPALLERQVQSGVHMTETLRRLAELGVDTVVEIGPGKALSGFVKKTVGDAITCYAAETPADVEKLCEVLKA